MPPRQRFDLLQNVTLVVFFHISCLYFSKFPRCEAPNLDSANCLITGVHLSEGRLRPNFLASNLHNAGGLTRDAGMFILKGILKGVILKGILKGVTNIDFLVRRLWRSEGCRSLKKARIATSWKDKRSLTKAAKFVEQSKIQIYRTSAHGDWENGVSARVTRTGFLRARNSLYKSKCFLL